MDARGVQIPDQPAVVHIAHNVLDTIERGIGFGCVVHGQRDAAQDHYHERDASERTKIPPIAQIPRNCVFIELVVHEREDWEPIVYPPHDPVLEKGVLADRAIWKHAR